MRCTNKVTQYIPKGYSYKEIQSPCGSTGIDGDRLLCDPCQNNRAKMAELRRHDANMEADNDWLRSAGWGEM